MKRIVLHTLLLALLLTGCNSFLDIQPKGILIPNTVEDYELLLNYEQLSKASENYPVFMTDQVFFPDNAIMGFLPGLDFLSSNRKNLYTFQPLSLVRQRLTGSGLALISAFTTTMW